MELELKQHEEKKEDKKDQKAATEVLIKANIFSIREIDTVQQTFTADFFLEAKISDPKYKGKLESEVDIAKEISYTYLNLISTGTFSSIVSHLELDREETWTRKYNKEDDTFVYRTRFLGKFAQKFNLSMFPFDTQSLRILVSSKKTTKVISLAKDRNKGRGDVLCTDPETAFTLAEWKLWNHIEVQETTTDPVTSSSGVVYPVVKYTVNVSRQYMYYFYNVMMIMFLLVTLSAASFAVPISDIGSRLAVTLTLVLTAIAFRLSVVQNMPKVSYTTFLDTYLWWCFGFLGLVTAENAIVFKIDFSEKNEIIFILAIGGLWILFNAIEVIRAFVHISSNRKQMIQKENRFKIEGVTSK